MPSSSALPPAVVHVLDRLPDPPATFTLRDVRRLLDEVRAGGVPTDLDADGVLASLLASESVSGAAGRYIVHADQRPF